jgi:hypothetical protein
MKPTGMSRPLQRLLPLILLAPLLAVVAMAALNLRPAVSLRLLIWTSPALPLGSWLALAVGGGGLLSAAATSAALQSGVAARRQVRLKAEAPGRRQEYAAWDPSHSKTDSRETAGQGNASGGNSSRNPAGRNSANRQNLGWEANDWNDPLATNPAPPRPPGAPPPTVEVPFRVIRKPAKKASAQPDSQPPKAAKADARDNSSANGGDGWDQSLPEQEDW